LTVVAVAPGAAAPSNGPSDDGTLDSLFEGRAGVERRVGGEGRSRSGGPEARTTTIHLSGEPTPVDPLPGGRVGAVPLRHIVGARASDGRWQVRARRTARVGSWLVAAATVGAGLLALWVLLFTTVSGGDVWLGRPLAPAGHDQPARQNAVDPASPAAGSVRPSPSSPPTPAAVATPTHSSGKGSASGGTATSGSGRNGADDPVSHTGSGSQASTPTAGATSGSTEHGGTSGGSGSGSGGSGSGSGGHGADG
jgi:hypothetical protein